MVTLVLAQSNSSGSGSSGVSFATSEAHDIFVPEIRNSFQSPSCYLKDLCSLLYGCQD